MKEAARLMAKVFAVVFGGGSAVVMLLYLVLGAYYIYGRIEQRNQIATDAQTSPAGKTGTFIKVYDQKSFPVGFVPDGLPNAELDCHPKDSLCSVLIDGRLAALISREEAKSNLAGWRDVQPLPNSQVTDNGKKP